jgi:hypothetical protein
MGKMFGRGGGAFGGIVELYLSIDTTRSGNVCSFHKQFHSGLCRRFPQQLYLMSGALE